MSTAIFFFSLIFLSNCAAAIREEDLITNLPNVTFQYSFRQYSGYLNANSEGTWKFFYWLTESMNNPEKDPLLVWFNGGPGCSSLSGLMAEYGPYFVNRNGDALHENVYAWNKHYNMLFIESPLGTGYSYNIESPADFSVGDDLTAEQNFHVLTDFFTRVQPRFKNYTWFLTGESYAGIFIPTLVNLVLKGIQMNEFPNINFQGFAIGNGYLNIQNLTNSLVHWNYYHGSIGIRQWNEIRQTCCNNTEPIESCDFSAHIKENITDTWALDECGELFVSFLSAPDGQNPYNYFLDCYKPERGVEKRMLPNPKLKRVLPTANLPNYDYTDNQLGFQCWNEAAMKTYLNKKEVQLALHVANEWIEHKDTRWEVCNEDIGNEYLTTYTDTFDLFKEIIARVERLKDVIPNNFRMLMFSGDIDTVCNFIGIEWHMENVANYNLMEPDERTPWSFRNQLAGYAQKYTKSVSERNNITIDVLTVKGAGHFVSDRPGPALQMIVNFVSGSGNYSDPQNIDVTPTTHDLPIKEPVVEPVISRAIKNQFPSSVLVWLNQTRPHITEVVIMAKPTDFMISEDHLKDHDNVDHSQEASYRRAVYGIFQYLGYGTIVLNCGSGGEGTEKRKSSGGFVAKLKQFLPLLVGLPILLRTVILIGQLSKTTILTKNWAITLSVLLFSLHGLIAVLILCFWNYNNFLNEFIHRLYMFSRTREKNIVNSKLYKTTHILSALLILFFLCTFVFLALNNLAFYKDYNLDIRSAASFRGYIIGHPELWPADIPIIVWTCFVSAMLMVYYLLINHALLVETKQFNAELEEAGRNGQLQSSDTFANQKLNTAATPSMMIFVVCHFSNVFVMRAFGEKLELDEKILAISFILTGLFGLLITIKKPASLNNEVQATRNYVLLEKSLWEDMDVNLGAISNTIVDRIRNADICAVVFDGFVISDRLFHVVFLLFPMAVEVLACWKKTVN